MKNIYLDNQSNTQLDERVYRAMEPYFLEYYGNAQSMHEPGSRSKDALEKARGQAAALVNADPKEIYFTSCGSEANNLAIKGVADANKNKGRHIVVSSIEHFSVLYSARRLTQQGFEVTYVPVDTFGVVSPRDVQEAITDRTILVSVQHANTEIGTVQNITEIAASAKAKGALFHTDAIAAAGTIPVDVAALGVDLLTFSGQQFYGPKGAAALFIKKGVRVTPQIDGGVQENGRRAGTENVPAIVGFGKACELAQQELSVNYDRMLYLRNRLINELQKNIEFIYLNGHPEKRLPNNVNFSVEFIEGEGMFLFLDQKGIFVSSGSACASKALKMSHVLTATNVDPAVGQGSILMSLSKFTSDEDIDFVVREFPPIVKKLRDISPLYSYFQKTGKRQEAGPGTDYEHHHDHEEE